MTAPTIDQLRERIKLVALDLDGTTLAPDSTVSPRTAEVVRAVLDRGVHVHFATGRMLGSTSRYAEEIGFAERPAVVLNGSLVTAAADDSLYDGAIPEAIVVAAHANALRVAERPGGAETSMFWFTRDELLTEPRWTGNWRYMLTWNNGLDQRAVPDLLALLPTPIYQVHYIGPQPALEWLADELADEAAVKTAIWPSARGPHLHLEVRRADCDKYTGVEHLHRILDVGWSQTLAVGDWLNDLQLISRAGFGVAMGNGCPELKAIADHVLPRTNAEHGMAEFLAEALL